MATLLTTEYQTLGSFTLREGSNYKIYVKAKYSSLIGDSADIHILLSMSAKNAFVRGRALVNRSSTYESYYLNSDDELSSYSIRYGSSGISTDNVLLIELQNISGEWSDGTGFGYEIVSQNPLMLTFDLPPIDRSVSISIISSSYSNTFHSYPVAGISSYNAGIYLRYARTAYAETTGAGVTELYTLSPTYVASETITQVFGIPPSSDDYSLSIKYHAANNRESQSFTRNHSIKGYSLPTFASGTYTRRCDSSGNSDPNGEYGRLYLTWTVTEVDSDDPNTLQLCTVKLNNTVISKIAGSIQDGYLDYIFPLAQNVQGNLEIYLEDEISNNTITSLVVPKSTMPLSLYQNGNSVGVAIGRMATQSGLWCYEQFYLKSSTNNSSKIFNIQVDDNGQITATEV